MPPTQAMAAAHFSRRDKVPCTPSNCVAVVWYGRQNFDLDSFFATVDMDVDVGSGTGYVVASYTAFSVI